jgi:hypothetical protein
MWKIIRYDAIVDGFACPSNRVFSSVQTHSSYFVFTKIGGHLDDEFIYTDSRSWRDLKLGITGSVK